MAERMALMAMTSGVLCRLGGIEEGLGVVQAGPGVGDGAGTAPSSGPGLMRPAGLGSGYAA
jgi:hypothetical protein